MQNIFSGHGEKHSHSENIIFWLKISIFFVGLLKEAYKLQIYSKVYFISGDFVENKKNLSFLLALFVDFLVQNNLLDSFPRNNILKTFKYKIKSSILCLETYFSIRDWMFGSCFNHNCQLAFVLNCLRMQNNEKKKN